MIRITNKHSTFITVEGNMIPPFKYIDIEMPRTPSIRSLERNGIIAISELAEPSTEEINEHNDIEQEVIDTANKEVAEKSSNKKKKKKN